MVNFRIGINRSFFGRDAERLKSCVFVGDRHSLVGSLVSAVHRFSVGSDRVGAAVLGADEIEVSANSDIKQSATAFTGSLYTCAFGISRENQELILDQLRSQCVVDVVDSTKRIVNLAALFFLLPDPLFSKRRSHSANCCVNFFLFHNFLRMEVRKG